MALHTYDASPPVEVTVRLMPPLLLPQEGSVLVAVKVTPEMVVHVPPLQFPTVKRFIEGAMPPCHVPPSGIRLKVKPDEGLPPA